MSSDSGVEQKILCCIDEALAALGKGGKRALKEYFHEYTRVEKDRILREPEVLSEKLGLVLGQQSAMALEAWIVRKLVSNFGLKDMPELTLTEAIKMIKAGDGGCCKKVKSGPRARGVSTNAF